mmetsp:Transcript_39813/g.94414  ORF Transcript_39813/g.94414 Transcript_39813/m.94414 type:complete len:224 (+) Transcript_39813:4634-5305(+)
MLVSQHLHLKMPAPAEQLHQKDRRPYHLGLHLQQRRREVLALLYPADPLPSPALRRLHHQRVPHHVALLERLLHCGDARLLVELRGHVGVARVQLLLHRDPGPAPINAWHAGGLRDDRGPDLVAQSVHCDRARAQKGDFALVRCKSGRKRRVLRRMPPASPHSIDLLPLGNVDNEIHVGVVIVVRAAGDLHDLVSEADVLGVGCEIIGCDHANEAQRLFNAEL